MTEERQPLFSRPNQIPTSELGLEEWLDPAVENSGNKKLVVVDVAAGVTGIIADDAEDKYGNPHIWLDPEYAKAGIGEARASGETFAAIAARLNHDGETTRTGRLWSGPLVRGVLNEGRHLHAVPGR